MPCALACECSCVPCAAGAGAGVADVLAAFELAVAVVGVGVVLLPGAAGAHAAGSSVLLVAAAPGSAARALLTRLNAARLAANTIDVTRTDASSRDSLQPTTRPPPAG